MFMLSTGGVLGLSIFVVLGFIIVELWWTE
jgi:hypothetical protein